MQTIVAIALGSAVGGVLRHLSGLGVKHWADTAAFPWHTMLINLAGCLLLGFLNGLFEKHGAAVHPDVRLALTVGVCGGFTTFSTFAQENITLLRQGAYGAGFGYIALSLLGGLLLAFCGFAAGRAL